AQRKAYDWSRQRRCKAQVSAGPVTIRCVLSYPVRQCPRSNPAVQWRPSGLRTHGDLFESIMKIEFPLQKKITLAALAILIGADATLAFFAMQSTRGLSRNELTAQKAQIKILKADIQRAQAIRQSML